jgi:hypothetical protein
MRASSSSADRSRRPRSARRSRRLRALSCLFVVAGVLALPDPLRAEEREGFLAGLTLGGGMRLDGGRTELDFRLGVVGDILFDSGLVIGTRFEVSHLFDANAAFGAGWFAPGLLDNRQLPLGGLLSAVIERSSSDRRLSIGGRAELLYGFYYSRAAVVLSITHLKVIDAPERATALVLAFRFVPWAPL